MVGRERHVRAFVRGTEEAREGLEDIIDEKQAEEPDGVVNVAEEARGEEGVAD